MLSLFQTLVFSFGSSLLTFQIVAFALVKFGKAHHYETQSRRKGMELQVQSREMKHMLGP
jgi:hypothetical protein